MLQLVK